MPPPVYCYASLADPVCYAEPLARDRGRLIGSQGPPPAPSLVPPPYAAPPPPADTPAVPLSRVPLELSRPPARLPLAPPAPLRYGAAPAYIEGGIQALHP